jgi:hypothetical protein
MVGQSEVLPMIMPTIAVLLMWEREISSQVVGAIKTEMRKWFRLLCYAYQQLLWVFADVSLTPRRTIAHCLW